MFSKAPHVLSANAGNFVGILYAEDFDDPADLDVQKFQKQAEPPPPPAITQADVDAACAAAVRAARLDWQVGQEQARTSAITSMNAVLKSLHGTAERTTLAVAEGTVTTILAMVSALLPNLAREHGPTEVRALLGRLLPSIRSRERISVRVHPELVAAIQRDLGGLNDDLASMVDVIAAPIELADVKVSWENGSMTRDIGQIARAVQDALSQLGLQQTIESPVETSAVTPAKRSMAYAD